MYASVRRIKSAPSCLICDRCKAELAWLGPTLKISGEGLQRIDSRLRISIMRLQSGLRRHNLFLRD